MLSRIDYAIQWLKKNQSEVDCQRERNMAPHKARKYARAAAYQRERAYRDPAFKLLRNLRSRLGAAIRGTTKAKTTLQLTGCSTQQLKAHIESLFTQGMTWDNYGTWHVDHITPCCKFDLSSPEEQAACFHYSNLQPLWAMDNYRKSGNTRSAVQ